MGNGRLYFEVKGLNHSYLNNYSCLNTPHKLVMNSIGLESPSHEDWNQHSRDVAYYESTSRHPKPGG